MKEFIVENPDRELMFLIQLKYRLKLEFRGIKFKGPKSAKQLAKERGYYTGNLTIAKLNLATYNIDKAIREREEELKIERT